MSRLIFTPNPVSRLIVKVSKLKPSPWTQGTSVCLCLSVHHRLPFIVKVLKKAEVYRNRLILGHCKLLDHMNGIMPSIYITPVCTCGDYRQTVEHYLLHCSINREARDQLIETIERGFLTSGIPSHSRNITVKNLLCPDFKKDFNAIVNKAVAKYLSAATTDL